MTKKNFLKYQSAKAVLENGNVTDALSMLEKSPKYVRMWLYSDIFDKEGIILTYNNNLRAVFLRVKDHYCTAVKPGEVKITYVRTTFDAVVNYYPALIKMMKEN